MRSQAAEGGGREVGERGYIRNVSSDILVCN